MAPIFAIVLFALVPIAALVLHTGMVLLARRQMQTATDAAALEGVRLRDDVTLIESDRRESVSRLVSQLFDDDLGASAADSRGFGAGPVVELDGGIPLPGTDFHASRSVTAVGVYDPVLQPNLTDAPHGDMLRGRYLGADASHLEAADYTRSDFASAGIDAFLVRLRRTRLLDGTAPSLDEQNGTSSSGPTVPYLFGRGAVGGLEALDRRERGTVMRTTSIAQARSVKMVGPAYPASMYDPTFAGIAGWTPFGLRVAQWNTMALGLPVTLEVVSDGSLEQADTPGIAVGQLILVGSLASPLSETATNLVVASGVPFATSADTPFRIRIDQELMEVVEVNGASWQIIRAIDGTFAAAHVALSVVVRQATLPIGRELSSLAGPRVVLTDLGIGAGGLHRYVPLYDNVEGDRIVGFGAVTWIWDAVNQQLVVTRLPGMVPPRNAAATWRGKAPKNLSEAGLDLLFTRNASVVGGLQAPVLVRAVP